MKMNYKNYLFIPINEVLDDKTMMDLGKMWQKHHDRSPRKRFEDRAEENASKFYDYMDKNEDKLNQMKARLNDEKHMSGYYKYDEYDELVGKNPNWKPTPAYLKFNKAINHLKNSQDRSDYYHGKKLGYEANPGRPGPLKSGRASIHGIRTMHQRAGERSMAAIGRLTDYLNRNGINQENPTIQDRSNFSSWKQRMQNHPLFK